MFACEQALLKTFSLRLICSGFARIQHNQGGFSSRRERVLGGNLQTSDAMTYSIRYFRHAGANDESFQQRLQSMVKS